MTFKLNLGDKVKDQITGFTGIITSRSEWISGCRRYGVQPDKLNKDGKPFESEHFDEEMLEVVKEKAKRASSPSGGPEKDERKVVRK